MKAASLQCLLLICLLCLPWLWGRSYAAFANPSYFQTSDRASPNLAIAIQANPESVNLGGELTLLISASNKSALQATNVELSVQLPETINLMSISPGETCVRDDITVSCVFPVLGPQESEEIALLLTPTEVQPLTFSANITAAERDFMSSDNNASVILTVQCVSIC